MTILKSLAGPSELDALYKLSSDPATHAVLRERLIADEHRDAVDTVQNARLLLVMHELRLAP